MGRENCQMNHIVGSGVYCDYYDFMYNPCSMVSKCPDGHDDDEYEETDHYYCTRCWALEPMECCCNEDYDGSYDE
jgi:hypothetical protein